MTLSMISLLISNRDLVHMLHLHIREVGKKTKKKKLYYLVNNLFRHQPQGHYFYEIQADNLSHATKWSMKLLDANEIST